MGQEGEIRKTKDREIQKGRLSAFNKGRRDTSQGVDHLASGTC